MFFQHFENRKLFSYEVMKLYCSRSLCSTKDPYVCTSAISLCETTAKTNALDTSKNLHQFTGSFNHISTCQPKGMMTSFVWNILSVTKRFSSGKIERDVE